MRSSLENEAVGIVATGDLMLGDSAICTGYGFASRYPREAGDRAIEGLRSILGEADIVFGNLECTLSDRGHEPRRWSSTQLRGHPSYAVALRAAGFNVLNVANNHASQHGDAAFHDTIELLRAAGILPIGVRGTGDWTARPEQMEVRGRHVGFLGYCLRPRQYSGAVPPFAEGELADIVRDVARLSVDVDHVIVSLHWGEEYVDAPS
jgi:poly-gamma-glutamate synthesis protein (capsule biosynthesis protein)